MHNDTAAEHSPTPEVAGKAGLGQLPHHQKHLTRVHVPKAMCVQCVASVAIHHHHHHVTH
jgi:hypothetical protein